MDPIIANIAVPNVGTVFSVFDIVATLLWAISGAMLAARRGFDIMGILILAMVSSVGGGLLRDGFFLQDGPARFLMSPMPSALIALAVLLVLLVGHRIRTFAWFGSTIAAIDALGAGAYAVVGIQLAMAADLPMGALVIVGMVNALGGGLLRDVLLNQVPMILKPGVLLGLAALAGCLVYIGLRKAGLESNLAGVATVATVFTIRMIALRFDLRTRALARFEEDWRQPASDHSASSTEPGP